MPKILYPEKDEFYCEIVAKSLAEIIRYSLDEDFRNRCFDLLSVNSTKELENDVRNRLVVILQNEKDKKGKNVKEEREKEISDKENSEPDSPVPSTSSGKRQMFQSDYDQNKKLCYYSQPLPNKPLPDFEFHSSTQIELPHPSSETSSSNPSQESTSSEPIDDINFYKQKFRESFKDNVHKYFRKNLNLKNHQ